MDSVDNYSSTGTQERLVSSLSKLDCTFEVSFYFSISTFFTAIRTFLI